MGNCTCVGPMVSMPLSYGSSLTRFGRRGAMKRDRNSGMTGKMTATTRKRATGPKVLSTLLGSLLRQHAAPLPEAARLIGSSIAELVVRPTASHHSHTADCQSPGLEVDQAEIAQDLAQSLGLEEGGGRLGQVGVGGRVA